MATIEQNALTVIAEIKPGEKDALNETLVRYGQNPAVNPQLPFGKVDSLHFSCFVIIDNDASYPPYLVFETNHDGDLEDHLNQLTDVASEGLREIFQHCVGLADDANADQVQAFLRDSSVPSAAFYVGCRGQSVGALKNAIAVREEIEKYLDDEQSKSGLDGLSAQKILERIQSHLAKPDVVSPQVSEVTVSQLKAQSKRNTILLALVALPIILLALPLIVLWLILLRIREFRDNHSHPEPLPIDQRVFEFPDIHAQSHLTTMSIVRTGFIRGNTLKFVLWVTSVLAKKVSIAGNLLGIPTIHFARWAMMDDNKRMIFFSNYDGSWASYLGDFVDKAKYGLTAIWGNTDRFPPSKWLMLGGAALIIPFKEWSREHNIYAPFFYRAYPSATVANLLNDLYIRDNVGRTMSESEAAEFLKAL